MLYEYYCYALSFLIIYLSFLVIETSAVSTLPTTLNDVPSPLNPIKTSESPAVAAIADAMADSSIDPIELKKRTEFLKEQRDKLLAMKKAEREKQLAEVEQQQLKSRQWIFSTWETVFIVIDFSAQSQNLATEW